MLPFLKPVICQLVLLWIAVVFAQFKWQPRDVFDEIQERVSKVHEENCKVIDVNQLFLPKSTISHIPDITKLGIDPVFPNRSNILHVQNMALSRAFYYSYILQKAPDGDEPGFMYYFLSAIADVAANRYINSSAIYFSPNMSFTPSYKGFFNKTMPLFAPRAFRSDDFYDPFHLERLSTLNTIEAKDLGAIPEGSISSNYTHDQYTINEWYSAWLPDYTKRQDSKTTYTVQITHINGTNETFVWHGPPASSDVPPPVKWIKPYFDCGRSNKWVFGAAVPIPDIFPRHTQWRHIEIPTYVAVAVMELDFDRIDINQCPIGEGNPAPNSYASTDRCRNDTTECEPIHGYGFRRGGYQCRCKPGFRLPRVVRSPFLGEIVERATRQEYNKGFRCEKISYMGVLTQNLNKLSEEERAFYIGRFSSRMTFDGIHNGTRIDPNLVTDFMKKTVNKMNCAEVAKEYPEMLKLRPDVAYGKEDQLENEARTALRLANFISSFLQIVDPKDMFAEFRVPDRPLTEDQIIGEVLSAVIGNEKIQGCGVSFERNQFINRTLFAPYAYRKERNTRTYFVEDLARQKDKPYTQSEWFQSLRTRWASNTDELETYTTKIQIRYNSSGVSNIRYDHYPLQYKAAELRHGYWTAPFFDCQGFHNQWLITYAAPFFGFDKIKSRLEFKGAVTVSMLLTELDLTQCTGNEYTPNAFKDTNKCDRASSRCVPILGRGFESGGYKCECRQGYEYPLNDPITYFDGQILEAEYEKMVEDKPSRFDTLECRIAGAKSIEISLGSILIVILLIIKNT